MGSPGEATEPAAAGSRVVRHRPAHEVELVQTSGQQHKYGNEPSTVYRVSRQEPAILFDVTEDTFRI